MKQLVSMILVLGLTAPVFGQEEAGKAAKKTKCYMCPDGGDDENGAAAECEEKEWIKAKSKKSCEAKGGTWIGKAGGGKKKKKKGQ